MTEDNKALPTSSEIEQMGLHALLGVTAVEVGPDRVVLAMPIGPKVHQHSGLLHGGVSALLAESAASIVGSIVAGPGKQAVGILIEASHLRGASTGTLIATATPIKLEGTIQVWRIELTDQDGRLISDAKCTLAVVDRPGT